MDLVEEGTPERVDGEDEGVADDDEEGAGSGDGDCRFISWLVNEEGEYSTTHH